MPYLLLVEDNPDEADLTLLGLKEANPARQIVRVCDGMQALEYVHRCCREGRELPALIILDLKLPMLGGLELLERMRGDARMRHLLVVVLTASAEACDQLEAKRLGVIRYVVKAPQIDEFWASLREIERLVPA